jgi:hypothetical protein
MSQKREEIIRRLRGGRPKRGVPWKLIASVVTTVAVFVLVCLVFDWKAGWPISLVTMGIMLGVAWFVSTLAGGRLAPATSVSTASLLAVALTVGSVTVGVPWRLKVTQETEETVLFRFKASFTYWGFQDNLPMENVRFGFPCPNIENAAADVPMATWYLYYVDGENAVHMQMTNGQVIEYRGGRMEPLGILVTGIQKTLVGPKIVYVLDRLYPRESFGITTYLSVPLKDANKLTLREFGGQLSSAIYEPPAGWQEPVNFSIWVQLSRLSDNRFENIETYHRYEENVPATYVNVWLYPT